MSCISSAIVSASRPLYWTQCRHTILFASESKAFLAYPDFRAEIDPQHVDELLAFRYIAGEATLLKGVRHVRPGRVLTITPDGTSERRYWLIPDYSEKSSLSREEAADQLNDLLRRSVRSQLQSEVPAGCQLSGGVDSSASLFPCLGVYTLDGAVIGAYGRIGRVPLIDSRAADAAVLAA